MDAAVGLKDEGPGPFHELLPQANQEKVGAQQPVALLQRRLRALEVVVDEQALQDAGDGIAVRILLLDQDPHQVLQLVAPPLVDHHRGSQVAQQVPRVGLDGGHVAVLEAEVDDGVASVLVIEEHEEGPVQQPRALRQLLHRVGPHLGVNDLLQPGEVLLRLLPVLHQNVGRKLAPQGADAALRAGAQRPVVAQELRSAWRWQQCV